MTLTDTKTHCPICRQPLIATSEREARRIDSVAVNGFKRCGECDDSHSVMQWVDLDGVTVLIFE